MKALTLTQPWASLVALHEKSIETRSWSTNYRGPLAIHAAKGLSSVGEGAGLIALCRTEPFATALRDQAGETFSKVLPLGVIVATCLLVDVRRIDEPVGPEFRKTHEFAFGDYTPGRYGWLLDCVAPVDPPIPARGQTILWEPDWHPVLEEAEMRLLEVQETNGLRCGVCGCTDGLACEEGCGWVSVDPPLCTACVQEQAA